MAEAENREDWIWNPKEKKGVKVKGQHFLVRSLQRLPRGLSYPDMVGRVAEIVLKVRDKDYIKEPIVYVNATRVGLPVVDLLAEEVDGSCWIEKVFMSSSPHRVYDKEGGYWKLGKALMVSRLQVLFQTDRLHMVRDNPIFQEMARELTEFELKVDIDSQNDRPFQVGRHDDLVTALGLALQADIVQQQGIDIW